MRLPDNKMEGSEMTASPIMKACVTGLTLLLFAGGYTTSKPIKYAELKNAVLTAYAAREELLRKSTGTARVLLPGGGELGTVTWSKNGKRSRFDTVVGEASGYRPRKIHEVDIEGRHEKYASSISASQWYIRFDINGVYTYDHWDVPRQLRELEAFPEHTDGWVKQRTVSRESVAGVPCVKLQWDYQKMRADGTSEQAEGLRLWLAPGMAYSLVRGEFKRCRWEAQYEESEEHPGTWLIKTLDVGNPYRPAGEPVRIEFSDVKIGVEVPDEVFASDVAVESTK
jgi:hypothetical protein